MKPHPRIRKTTKWGGAAVTVLLVVVWIGSEWYCNPSAVLSGRWLAVDRGRLLCGRWNEGVGPEPPKVAAREEWVKRTVAHMFAEDVIFHALMPRAEPPWKAVFGEPNWVRDGSEWILAIPFWLLVAAVLPLTGFAWHRDRVVRRLQRAALLNLCPKCDYDRAGIAGDAKCPECGAMPVRR
jgi:hypothetical protein